MAQTEITAFYSSKKRFKEPSVKRVQNVRGQKLSKSKAIVEKINEPSQSIVTDDNLQITNEVSQNKLTDNLLDSENEISQDKKIEAPRTPKRNLSSPDEMTPTKKKLLKDPVTAQREAHGNNNTIKLKQPTSKLKKTAITQTAQKIDPTPRRKLVLINSPSPSRLISPRKATSPVKSAITPQKAASYENMNKKNLSSLLQESRTKILFGGKLDELKKSLEKFSKASAKAKEFQSNSCKITSVVGSAVNSETSPKSLIQGDPAFKKFSYLAASESHSLVLPYKYKLLGETFRCMDTVVSMLNNRKEKITFEKVQSGVQKMMNKNFLKNHLTQIMKVFPDAYILSYERNHSHVNNKSSSPYLLVITPKFTDLNGNSFPTEATGRQNKKVQNSFTQMTPQILLERKNFFIHNLTNIAKFHHQAFLTRLNFPPVDNKAILRWHPKFNVDGIPDIPQAVLPQEPDSKVHTAKDVLSKIRGSVQSRVEKALQSVSEEYKKEPKEKSPAIESKNKTISSKQNSALKGICTDLLEKIRARESAKLVENMTRSVQDERRSAMLERLPKIVNILWHYFIAERKAAVPVDDAVDKIIHSFNSLTTPDEVKEHLQLILETMPGWLSFIKIPKGEYITMDKKKDINEMISNLK